MVTIKVISAHKKRKQYRDKNYSGRYHMVEIVDERPVYKVSLIIGNSDITFEVLSIFYEYKVFQKKNIVNSARRKDQIWLRNLSLVLWKK